MVVINNLQDVHDYLVDRVKMLKLQVAGETRKAANLHTKGMIQGMEEVLSIVQDAIRSSSK